MTILSMSQKEIDQTLVGWGMAMSPNAVGDLAARDEKFSDFDPGSR